MDLLQNPIVQFLYFIVALLINLSVHEASHAMAAYYLGDPTAKMKGRLTLNPIAHLDSVGTIVFLLTQRIGWGKPVPVDPRNFKHPVRDNALTALAGPVSNFVLAFALGFVIKYLNPYFPEFIKLIVWMTFNVSIFLGVFNLFPFPPLDGSKILGLVIPRRWYRQYQRFLIDGMKYFVVIILIDVFVLDYFFHFSFFRYVMVYLYQNVKDILLIGT